MLSTQFTVLHCQIAVDSLFFSVPFILFFRKNYGCQEQLPKGGSIKGEWQKSQSSVEHDPQCTFSHHLTCTDLFLHLQFPFYYNSCFHHLIVAQSRYFPPSYHFFFIILPIISPVCLLSIPVKSVLGRVISRRHLVSSDLTVWTEKDK